MKSVDWSQHNLETRGALVGPHLRSESCRLVRSNNTFTDLK